MSTATLAEWLLAAALHFSPPEKLPQFPGHEETRDQAVTRYASIVDDIVAAVDGVKAPKHAAALALAWGIGESALAHDADLGPCHREGRWKKRCDGGLAASIWQVHATTFDGELLKVEDLFGDRARTARLVVQRMASSWVQCRHLEPRDRFSAFGIGRCVEGNEQVRKRFALYQTIAGWKPKP